LISPLSSAPIDDTLHIAARQKARSFYGWMPVRAFPVVKGKSYEKREYVEATTPMWDDNQSVRIYLNGEEALQESRTSVLYDFLNKLGREGWEMVSFAFYPNRTTFYYFKRA
jgi:hypothetical protein